MRRGLIYEKEFFYGKGKSMMRKKLIMRRKVFYGEGSSMMKRKFDYEKKVVSWKRKFYDGKKVVF